MVWAARKWQSTVIFRGIGGGGGTLLQGQHNNWNRYVQETEAAAAVFQWRDE